MAPLLAPAVAPARTNVPTAPPDVQGMFLDRCHQFQLLKMVRSR